MGAIRTSVSLVRKVEKIVSLESLYCIYFMPSVERFDEIIHSYVQSIISSLDTLLIPVESLMRYSFGLSSNMALFELFIKSKK